MKCINNKSLLSSSYWIAMNFIMALPANGCKKLAKAKPLANPSSLMVDICRFGLLTSLAYWVESHVGIANLCILLVFALSLSGCASQPAFAFKWGAAF